MAVARVRRRTAVAPRGGVRGRPQQAELADKRREQILEAATRHFARDGFHETDVQVLADELQLGKGTIYRYFQNKEDLFLCAVDRVMARLRRRIDALEPRSGDPLDLIASAMIEYLTFFDAHPEFVELLILERAVFRERKKPTYFEYRERNVARWRAIYRDLIQRGRVRPMPPAAITDVVSSALYGAMFTNFFAGRKKSLEAQAAELVDVLFRGILSDKERAALARRAGNAGHGGRA
ncbi:MAG: hypothetical protein CHACPFDD_02929 [Phycisphaerae bacterium]|nr:hypothetical protein [Phycisphaerae bacterium]